MRLWIRSWIDSRFGIYVQFLIPLLLLTALIFGLMAATGCGQCTATSSPSVQQKHTWNASYQCLIIGPENAQYELDRTTRTLSGVPVGTIDPGPVTYYYTPPFGIGGIIWDPTHLPENPEGPAPYIFRDVPASENIQISFANPVVDGSTEATEVLEAHHSDGSASYAARQFTIYEHNAAQILPPPAAPARPPAAPAGDRTPAQDSDVWDVGRWVDVYGIELTTSLCDDWLGLLQSDAAFLAARLPIVPPLSPTQSYTLPLALRSANSATLSLIDYTWPQTTIISAPLELRPERIAFANAELPAAPDEAYVALGLTQAPLSCPAGLAVAADNWGLLGSVWLDLRAQPDNCEGCTLPLYYCYEGQELPNLDPLPAALTLPLARAAGLETYQGQGITCLGPHDLYLSDQVEWELGGGGGAWFSPTVPISFSHYIVRIAGSGAMTCTLDISSTLDAGWALYEGDGAGPAEPPVEIPQPLRVENGWLEFWVIGQPASPPEPGPYSLTLSGTCQGVAGAATTSDLFWIGGWIAPPPPDGGKFALYLPLLLRGAPPAP
jgi:hypothetical protein